MQAEHLDDPLSEPGVVAGERRQAPDVGTDEVQGRTPLDDPLGQGPARSSRTRDPHRVEARTDGEARQLRRLPADELVVGREALGTVVELADPRLGEHRESVDRTLHEHLEVLPVLVEQRELEGVGDAVGRHPRFRRGLETADEEPTDLLLDVGVPLRIPQHRQVAVDSLDRLGHDVEVLCRVQRDVDPGHRADGPGPLTDAAQVGTHVRGGVRAPREEPDDEDPSPGT